MIVVQSATKLTVRLLLVRDPPSGALDLGSIRAGVDRSTDAGQGEQRERRHPHVVRSQAFHSANGAAVRGATLDE